MTEPRFSAELVLNADHYRRVVEEGVLRAQNSVLVATANVKDLHVSDGRPLLVHIAGAAGRGVKVAILHSSAPGPQVRKELAALGNHNIHMRLCPRVHMKAVVVDGRTMYLGSANLTGAALGMRADHRRNFEAGVRTTDPAAIDRILALFDGIWSGRACAGCGIRRDCPAPLDGGAG